jgi:chromosome segregation ATPase
MSEGLSVKNMKPRERISFLEGALTRACAERNSRDAELASLRERLAGMEEQSEARRRALLAVGDERRVEWTRAENAEAERDAALAKLAEAERKGEALRHLIKGVDIGHDMHFEWNADTTARVWVCKVGCRACAIRAALQPVTEEE